MERALATALGSYTRDTEYGANHLFASIEWLKETRAYYVAKEEEEERTTLVIRDEENERQDYSDDNWPTVALLEPDDLFIEYCYIINLDAEVLTMQYGVHWNLQNMPRDSEQWMKSISDTTHHFKITINPDICGPEYMGCPAIPLREPDWSQVTDADVVTPRTNLKSVGQVFLSHCAGKIFSSYNVEMTRFSREWEVDSFTLREFVFAFVSIASGQTSFVDLHKKVCDQEMCKGYWCQCQRFLRAHNWFDKKCGGELAPLPVFGSLCHLSGMPAGASPTTTTYWHQGVAVHISLVVDGKAINEAVDWGVEQGQDNFQLVVMSAFQVTFAEVSHDSSGSRSMKITKPLYLSPLRPENCLSTHPLERPVLPEDQECTVSEGDQALLSNCFGSKRKLASCYPGICALVNFFEVAQDRASTAKIAHKLPTEIFHQVLDCVDYDTWKILQNLHHGFRAVCLARFRIDSTWSIVSEPVARKSREASGRRGSRERHLLSFDMENSASGEVRSITQVFAESGAFSNTWVPIIGGERKVMMLDVKLSFERTGRNPLEDGDDNAGLYEIQTYTDDLAE